MRGESKTKEQEKLRDTDKEEIEVKEEVEGREKEWKVSKEEMTLSRRRISVCFTEK